VKRTKDEKKMKKKFLLMDQWQKKILENYEDLYKNVHPENDEFYAVWNVRIYYFLSLLLVSIKE